MIVTGLMMSAGRVAQAEPQPLWFVLLLAFGLLAFCIWGFIALASLEAKRGK